MNSLLLCATLSNACISCDCDLKVVFFSLPSVVLSLSVAHFKRYTLVLLQFVYYDTTVKSNYAFHLCDIQINSIVANMRACVCVLYVYCNVQVKFRCFIYVHLFSFRILNALVCLHKCRHRTVPI